MEDKKEETKAQEEKENNKPKSNFKNITFEMVLPTVRKATNVLIANNGLSSPCINDCLFYRCFWIVLSFDFINN